jgi:hypothetical protein
MNDLHHDFGKLKIPMGVERHGIGRLVVTAPPALGMEKFDFA